MNNNSILFSISIFFLIISFLINIILLFNTSFLIVLIIDILLLLFYILLFKKIKILNDLKKYKTKKIEELRTSRSLFLRNIRHELITPITKGKLLSDSLEDNRKKEILQKVFYRLEYLLIEFSKVEELTSRNIKLNKIDFKVLDLLNHSIDSLLLDESKIDIDADDIFIKVDFELFSIALKNLIDNSIKYKLKSESKPKIIVREKYIKIKNKGTKLSKPIDNYFKPFNREYESIDKGLGVGLFITNSILELHEYKLEYFYVDDHHIFKIILKN